MTHKQAQKQLAAKTAAELIISSGLLNVSFLWNDLYNFTMSFFAWMFYREYIVTYKFKNRKATQLTAEEIDIDVLRELFKILVEVRITDAELEKLAGHTFGKQFRFPMEWLKALQKGAKLSWKISKQKGQIVLIYSGPWWFAVFYETTFLRAMQAVKTYGLTKNLLASDLRLIDHQAELRCKDSMGKLVWSILIAIMEFGTRRASSSENQELRLQDMINILKERLVGTSNVYLAFKYGLKPLGTMAHQLFMVLGVVHGNFKTEEEFRLSQLDVITKWHALFDGDFQVLLPDTYTTDWFLENLPALLLLRADGFRQDSGSPYAFFEKILAFYKKHGLTEEEISQKTIAFSDGLTADEINRLFKFVDGRMKVVFGWGTDVTYNLGEYAESIGLKPASWVIKPEAVLVPFDKKQRFTAKLSDIIEKAVGRSWVVRRIIKHITKKELMHGQIPVY